MIGLRSNIVSSSITSDNAPVVSTLGNFSITTTLSADVTFFKIMAKKVEHKDDPTDNDNDPKVIISDLVVKVGPNENGLTIDNSFRLLSHKVGSNNSSTHITWINGRSMSFEDTAFPYLTDTTLYEDPTSSNYSAESGETIRVTGNIKLANGTAYNPETGAAEAGRLEFTFNTHTGTAGNKLQVFLDPSYSGSAVGTVDEFTTVSS